MADRFERYDVIYPRNYEKKDGTHGVDWHRVGVAFKGEKQFTLTLYCLPVGGIETPGEVRMLLKPSEGPGAYPSQQRGGQPRGPEVQQRRPQPQRRDEGPPVEGWPPRDDDQIPF